MKRLIIIIMILSIAFQMVAVAETKSITTHYAVLFNSNYFISGKGEQQFEFDSLTIDVYLTENGIDGYMQITRFASGIFLNANMKPIQLVDLYDGMYLVDSSGYYYSIKKDENDDSLWIQYANHYFKMTRMDPISTYEDWQ